MKITNPACSVSFCGSGMTDGAAALPGAIPITRKPMHAAVNLSFIKYWTRQGGVWMR